MPDNTLVRGITLNNSLKELQDKIDELKVYHKNILIVLGFTGKISCYLNITIVEALNRLKLDGFSLEDMRKDTWSINFLGFDDSFEIYDIEWD